MIVNMQDHIRLAIAIHVSNLRSNRRQILTIAKQGRAIIDAGMRRISPRQFEDHYMPVEVDKDKVRGIARAIVVAYYGINLKGARPAICHVILVYLPPRTDGA